MSRAYRKRKKNPNRVKRKTLVKESLNYKISVARRIAKYKRAYEGGSASDNE